MSIIYMLIPALAWGVLPLAVARIKGKPINQILGTTVGTLIVGLITLPFIKLNIDAKDFLDGSFSWCLLGYWSTWSVYWLC